MRPLLFIASCVISLTPLNARAANIWETCFPSRAECVAARNTLGWPTIMAEELCSDTGNGCTVPKDYYTIPECERRFFGIKMKLGCTWDRTGIARHCRNTDGGKNTRPEWIKAQSEGKLDATYDKRCW